MAAVISDNLTVTSVQARKAMLKAFKSKRPLFIWGPPGIGKSEVVADVTAELGGHMIDLRMAQMEPTDIRGIPFFNRDINKMDWASPVDLPDQELADKFPIVVLFLTKIGILTPGFLKRYRKHTIVVILIVAGFITPSPDVFSQLIVAFPLYLLFEISLQLSKRIYRKMHTDRDI